ncbi:MAG: hypothetical protein RBQ99_07315 [Trichlorobacter sp.]|nr:hypothetical protein [Trichlorobacter sp.]
MSLNAEIKENKLHITIDLEKLTPSASGKTLTVDGKPFVIGLSAYIKP